jgi:hypothetical protein
MIALDKRDLLTRFLSLTSGFEANYESPCRFVVKCCKDDFWTDCCDAAALTIGMGIDRVLLSTKVCFSKVLESKEAALTTDSAHHCDWSLFLARFFQSIKQFDSNNYTHIRFPLKIT